jgi:hypothetical protein
MPSPPTCSRRASTCIHVVFTFPHELNRLARVRLRLLYDLLFHAASDTLQTFARDPQHLGGEPGIIAVLHTESQTLRQTSISTASRREAPRLWMAPPGLPPEGKRLVV